MSKSERSFTYEHFCYAPDEPSAAALAAELQAAGAIVPGWRPSAVTGSTEWLVMAYTDYGADTDPDGWHALRREFRRLATLHGGMYDGGGMYVGPLPSGAGEQR